MIVATTSFSLRIAAIALAFGALCAPATADISAGSSGPAHAHGFGFIPNAYWGLGGKGNPMGGDTLSSDELGLPQFGPLAVNGLPGFHVKTPYRGMHAGPAFGITPYGYTSFSLSGKPIFWGVDQRGGPGFGVRNPFIGWGVTSHAYALSGAGFGLTNPFFWGLTPATGMGVGGHAPAGAMAGGAQFVQCTVNGISALTRSVDDCEKAGGTVRPRTSAVN